MTRSAVSPQAITRQIDSHKLTLVEPDFTDKLRDQIEAFKVHLLIMKGIGKKTIDNYRKIVVKSLREMGTTEPTHQQVQQRVAWTFGQGYSYFHITNVIRAMEAYMAFIGNPIKFGRPKKPKTIVKDGMTEAEVAIILAASKNTREKAILAVLAYTGIRNQELCDLRLRDVDLAHNLVRVLNGKGSKGRTVCMSGDCTHVLLQYLAKYPRTPDEYLFTTMRARTQYSTWALRRLVKRVVARTGFDKRVHPHLFRHSLASNMLARGANLLTIKEQLGHSFIETTMIYIKSRQQRVQSEYQMFTPSYT